MVGRRRARKHNRAHDGDGVAVDKHGLAAEVEKGNGARKLRRQPQPFAIGLEFGHQDARHLAALLLGARRLAREQPHVLHADDVRLNLLSGARFFEDTLVVAVYVDDVEERHGVCGEVWGEVARRAGSVFCAVARRRGGGASAAAALVHKTKMRAPRGRRSLFWKLCGYGVMPKLNVLRTQISRFSLTISRRVPCPPEQRR